ncbi:MAG: ATP-binding protein [Puniceicoccales bacterium]|nr:ATP-binding protein [Puniceicoccales bacterium]
MKWKVQKLFEKFPMVGIVGPRQSGKTTLAKDAFPMLTYVNLEAIHVREIAQNDPQGFLKSYPNGAIFDEIQNVPTLFPYLQVISDERGTSGQYVLTGSHHFLLLEKISQSLAGRIALTTLLPLSLDELNPRTESPFPVAFEGFYPGMHSRKIEPNDFYGNYLTSYVERDVRQIMNLRDLAMFQKFLRLCAGRAGQLLNLSSLANDCGISQPTARQWLSVLEASFIVFLLQPNHSNFNKRLIKSPKLYFHDTGLLCNLLNISSANQLESHYLRGEIFENLVVGDIGKNFYNNGQLPTMSFWRDQRGVEIDLIVEKDGKTQAIGIKSGQTMHQDFLKNLIHWRELSPTSSLSLIYGGSEKFQQHGIGIHPWFEHSIRPACDG